MPTGRPIPCEGNRVDGMSRPSKRDVEPQSPFKPLSRLPVDCSSEDANSDSDSGVRVSMYYRLNRQCWDKKGSIL